MKKIFILLSLISIVFFSCNSKKELPDNIQSVKFEENNDYYRVMFYNLENLFDTEDDPEKSDEEFTPDRC